LAFCGTCIFSFDWAEMKKLYIVPKGAFPIHKDADLATIRSRLQRWIDSSQNGTYLGLKPFNRRSFEKYHKQSEVNVNNQDLLFLKQILKARFSIHAWIKQTTPTKLWMLANTYFTKYELSNKLEEVLSYRGLGAKVIEEKDFYFFKLFHISITPIDVWLDMGEFKLTNLEPCVLRRTSTKTPKDYSVRKYIPVLNERTGIVWIGEKTVHRYHLDDKGFLSE
jgi:hypothetical protein